MCDGVVYRESARDLEERMLERGVEVDYTTLSRWIQRYAPEMEKRLRWYYKSTLGYSWQVDETYVKVKGLYDFSHLGQSKAIII